MNSYYEDKPDDGERTEEADKVALRIAALLSERAFSFTPNEYLSIHRKLFAGIYGHAGKIRDCNITKKEWVLDGASVIYGSASELKATLEYDFSQEKNFSYRNLSMEEIIHHLAVFVSRLWQIHVFSEGNTRTTAVFFIKYLRTLGFDVTNDIFAENAWYFRNALVRANYTNLREGIHETTEYLELFLRNHLLNEKNELHNRSMHISGMFREYEKVDIRTGKADIGIEKTDIRAGKADIGTEKPDIRIGKANIEAEKTDVQECKNNHNISMKMKLQYEELLRKIGVNIVFGRADVENVLSVKASRASEILKELKLKEVIVPVQGYGKGKYKFPE